MTSHPAEEVFGPWWETSQDDEQNLLDRNLKHNPAGGIKRDGLAVNRDAVPSLTWATVNNLL